MLVMNAKHELLRYVKSIVFASTPSTDFHGCKTGGGCGKASHEGTSNNSSPADNVSIEAALTGYDGKVPIWAL